MEPSVECEILISLEPEEGIWIRGVQAAGALSQLKQKLREGGNNSAYIKLGSG